MRLSGPNRWKATSEKCAFRCVDPKILSWSSTKPWRGQNIFYNSQTWVLKIKTLINMHCLKYLFAILCTIGSLRKLIPTNDIKVENFQRSTERLNSKLNSKLAVLVQYRYLYRQQQRAHWSGRKWDEEMVYPCNCC